MNNSAVIIGASYAGLSAAAALQCHGWHVTVLERSTQLSRSGGGVVVQKEMADYLESHGIAQPRVSSVPAKMRMTFEDDGSVLRFPESAVAFTAWDILLKEIESTVGNDNIRRGTEVVAIDPSGSVTLGDGSTLTADLIVAADGIGSAARRTFLPDHRPRYSGYVAWRGMVPESDLAADLRIDCDGSLCIYSGTDTNIVVYEVPGADGSIEPGRRRVNWVWYRNVSADGELRRLLTDAGGRLHRATIPRGRLPVETDRAIRDVAKRELLDRFARIVSVTPELFVQAIFDFHAPRLVFDRVVLIGDAASLVRPHVGSGTAKAVDDAIHLAQAVTGPDYCERGCLRAWEARQLENHFALMEQSRAVAQRMGLGRDAGNLFLPDDAEVAAV